MSGPRPIPIWPLIFLAAIIVWVVSVVAVEVDRFREFMSIVQE